MKMKFKHVNIHAENLLNEAMIVLIETEISGMYRVAVDYTNELEEKYHTVESVCRLFNDQYGVAVWKRNDAVEANFK